MSSWFWKSHALLVIEVRSYNFYSILFTINDTKTIYQHNHIQHGKRLQEKSENDCTTISTFMTPTNPYIINILQLPPDSISITLLLRSSSNIGNGLVHFLVTVSLKILADFISKSKKSLEILVQKSDTSFQIISNFPRMRNKLYICTYISLIDNFNLYHKLISICRN